MGRVSKQLGRRRNQRVGMTALRIGSGALVAAEERRPEAAAVPSAARRLHRHPAWSCAACAEPTSSKRTAAEASIAEAAAKSSAAAEACVAEAGGAKACAAESSAAKACACAHRIVARHCAISSNESATHSFLRVTGQRKRSANVSTASVRNSQFRVQRTSTHRHSA